MSRAPTLCIMACILAVCAIALSACSDDHAPNPDIQHGRDTSPSPDARAPDASSDPDAAPEDAGRTPTDVRTPRDTNTQWEWDLGQDTGPDIFRVEQVVPARGPVQGNNRVRILGTGFAPGTQVFLGRSPMQVDITRTQMVGRAPAASGPGLATVRVVAPDGRVQALVDAYEYVAGLQVDQLAPARVPTTGHTEVLITGAGFSPEAAVSLSGMPALRVTFVDANHLRVLTPARPAGPADLRVTTRAETAQRAGALEYFEPLRIDQVRPASGPIAGGQTVTIDGRGFGDQTRFFFGAQPAQVLSIDAQASRATVRTPAGAAGLVFVRAETDTDSAIFPDAYLYRADDTPQLVALSPRAGSTRGGTEVELRGFGLERAGVEFVFGPRPAIILERGDSWARVQTPANPPGRVDVVMRDAHSELGRLVEAFEYQQDVALDSVQPTEGPREGNTQVTLRGSGFTGAQRVEFGGVAATFEVRSDTEIRAHTPAHAAGKVDVRVERGALQAVARDAFEFTEDLEIWGFDPIRGAIAGRTFVRMRGQGFRQGARVFFDDLIADDVQVLDANLLQLRTPAHPAGEAAVRVESGADDVARAPYPFEFFNPGSRFGGATGQPVDGAVNITVFADGGGPIPGAFVMLSTRADTPYQGITDENGMLTLSGPDVLGAQTVTATARDYASATVQAVDAENITLFLGYLKPDMDGGAMPGGPGIPYATIRGRVDIQGKLADPGDTRTWDMAVVGTTRETSGARRIDPGPGATVLGSGNYEIISRTGDLAVIALCGVYDDRTQEFSPQYMGIQRYMVVADRGEYRADLTCDIPLDRAVGVKLINPVWAPDGPDNNVVQVHWNLGVDGVFSAPRMARGQTDLLYVPMQPAAHSVLRGMTWSIVGGSFTGTYAPSTQANMHGITSIDSTIVLPALLDVPEPVSPRPGEPLAHNTLVFEAGGPYRPDFYSVQLYNDTGLLFWRVILPGNQTTVRLPQFPDFSHLPEDIRPNPWETTSISMTIIAVRAHEGFNLESFTYRDLTSDNWRGYALTRWDFLPPRAP